MTAFHTTGGRHYVNVAVRTAQQAEAYNRTRAQCYAAALIKKFKNRRDIGPELDRLAASHGTVFADDVRRAARAQLGYPS